MAPKAPKASAVPCLYTQKGGLKSDAGLYFQVRADPRMLRLAPKNRPLWMGRVGMGGGLAPKDWPLWMGRVGVGRGLAPKDGPLRTGPRGSGFCFSHSFSKLG